MADTAAETAAGAGADAPLLVLSTAPDARVADQLARGLVEARLAACVNLLPGATSVYRWEGRVESAEEVLMVIKTTAQRWSALQAHLAAHHPYQLPECVAIRPDAVEARYLAWMRAESSG